MVKYDNAIKNKVPNEKIKIIEDLKAAALVNSCVDDTLAREEIGYKPDFTVEQGIEDHIKMLSFLNIK